MSNEEDPEPEPEDEQTPEQEEEQQEEEQDQPVHSCGAKLQVGMKFCPGCGAQVDRSSYK